MTKGGTKIPAFVLLSSHMIFFQKMKLSFEFFLLCFPLRKLPLSFLTLEKGLYLREQDTGQGLHLMGGYSRCRSR